MSKFYGPDLLAFVYPKLADSQEDPAEALERHARSGKGNEEGSPLPDLIIVDGGKGQLGMACRELQALGLHGQPIIGLAKEFEEIYRPGEGEVISLPKASAGLRLLQHLRDEAHRFAVAYHRLLRGKRMLVSSLDGIKGLGSKRRSALLEKFGSVERIKQAELEDLASVPGISPALAERIASCLSP